mmetsp:Transcript_18266/g.53224  ORF Transcript_18266/g.53224 Transcript_18266/m.53224 type:complete len:268 (-) Transcript_18266:1127-1930(-)
MGSDGSVAVVHPMAGGHGRYLLVQRGAGNDSALDVRDRGRGLPGSRAGQRAALAQRSLLLRGDAQRPARRIRGGHLLHPRFLRISCGLFPGLHPPGFADGHERHFSRALPAGGRKRPRGAAAHKPDTAALLCRPVRQPSALLRALRGIRHLAHADHHEGVRHRRGVSLHRTGGQSQGGDGGPTHGAVAGVPRTTRVPPQQAHAPCQHPRHPAATARLRRGLGLAGALASPLGVGLVRTRRRFVERAADARLCALWRAGIPGAAEAPA